MHRGSARLIDVCFISEPGQSSGSAAPEFKGAAEPCAPARLWNDGNIQINFNQLLQTAAFADGAARQDLMDGLNAIPGVALRSDTALLVTPGRRFEGRMSTQELLGKGGATKGEGARKARPLLASKIQTLALCEIFTTIAKR